VQLIYRIAVVTYSVQCPVVRVSGWVLEKSRSRRVHRYVVETFKERSNNRADMKWIFQRIEVT